ncbi:MAG TPA: hypothetical protein VN108_11735 [Marmoricola sp.]|nr:hypothetical protein [Marmoricola sp.]
MTEAAANAEQGATTGSEEISDSDVAALELMVDVIPPPVLDRPAETSVTPAAMAYEAFGEKFLREVLHLDRILQSVDRILGDDLRLGPIGAGPGRKMATLTAFGTFMPSYGETLPGPLVAYKVYLPVDVTFEIDLHIDVHRFHAEVLVPLTIVLRLEEPLTVVWDLIEPREDELTVNIKSGARRSTVLQKMAGLDAELRRFLLRFVQKELDKPHVRKARRINVAEVIDVAWPEISAQFLPNSDADRQG